jgi:hypothetical protein
MDLKKALTVTLFFALIMAFAVGPGYCERTMVLSVCQELVNSARGYEARATAHSRIAKSLQAQIENLAKMPQSSATMQAMDSLFAQYDENRAMEMKMRDLYRQSTQESDRCMRSAD